MKALIFGITGQDGSYLADFLLSKGYEVHGVVRRSSSFNTSRLEGLVDYEFRDSNTGFVKLHYGDVCDVSSITRIILDVQPDEVYNLAAQSHVKVSFEQPDYTADVIVLGTIRILEVLKAYNRNVKYYQASSSEMFGNEPPIQNEETKFVPVSPYGISKLAAHNFACNYRDVYKMHISCGILFNHESPKRAENFVSRKITRAAARISLGLENKLYLGNIEAKRDFGYAKDYVEAMWLMLQQDKPDDYIISTGKSYSIEEFTEKVFSYLNLDYKKYIRIVDDLKRPVDVNYLCGDYTKAKTILGWTPSTDIDSLIKIMVDSDLNVK